MNKTFSTNFRKVLLITLISIPFLALVILTFFAFPQQDDYILPALLRKYGDWGAFKWMYQGNTGRYTSHIISILFERNNFIFEHYYVYPVLMLLLTFSAIFFFLHQINLLIYNRTISFFEKLFYSFVLTYVVFNSLPIVSGAVYWFASASNYQPAIILSIFLAGFFTKYLYSNKSVDFAAILVLLFLLNGTNEATTMFTSFAATIIGFVAFRNKKISKVQFLLILTIVSVSFSFMFFGAGIKKRQGLMPGINVMYSLLSLSVHEAVTVKDILSSSLFLFFGFDLIQSFRNIQPKNKGLGKKNRIALLLVLLIGKVFSLFVILVFTHGSIPDRVLNNIAFYDVVLLILFIYVIAGNIFSKTNANECFWGKWKYFIYVALVFSTGLFTNTFHDFISGYMYHRVNTERLQLVHQATAENKNTVVFQTYDSSIKKILATKHLPYRVKLTAREKPELLLNPYENNEKITFLFWLSQYNIDTIQFEGMNITEKILEKL